MVEGIQRDYKQAPISGAEHALLDFTTKLTREPWACTEADVHHLREAGWSDRAVLDLTLVVGYFAFVNRIADGLGVPLEDKSQTD